MEDRLPRKLAAILYADVAGYSRLTGEDEDATHRRLRDYLDLIAKAIEDHHGQVMHYAGDAVLAKFDAVVDALSSAVAIQNKLKHRNQDLPDKRKVQFRIGVNLGDVIEDRGDIYGDGVNVAARLESLADSGGICISESVRTAIGNKLPYGYEFTGEQQVKNIEEPVRAYKIVLGSEEKTRVASPGKPTLELPDKPSIAVLPFTNMSGDPEQEYFSDGITEDIITELSRCRSLFVIARNSTFVFKDAAVDVKEVGERLGVRYVLEGSVRKAGNRVRVTAQLVDAESGHHIWAERYDRNLEEIFTVQDEVTQNIVATLPGRVEVAGAERASRKRTDNLVAYDYILRGEQQLNLFTEAGNERAIELFEKALELDPQCGRVYAGRGFAYQLRMWLFGTFEEDWAERAYDNAQKALSLDATDSRPHAILCDLHLNRGQHDQANSHIQKAIKLNPNDSFAAWEMVFYLAYVGRAEEAIDWAKKAARLNPYHPEWYLEFLGDAYYMARRYDEAIETFERWDTRPFWINAELAAFYAQVGCPEKARANLKACEAARPEGSTLEEFLATHRQVCKRVADWEHWLEGYRKAGLSV